MPSRVLSSTSTDFNPRSRVGNDTIFPFASLRWSISIHVPAWGTTLLLNIIPTIFHYFNPRSRVGNDASLLLLQLLLHNFNPRSRVGNDVSESIPCQSVPISIHVPAWGTTAINADTVANMQFQSTFPRGERQESSDLLEVLRDISIHVPAWGTTTISLD